MVDAIDMQKLIAEMETAAVGSDKLDREICSALDIEWSADEGGNYGPYNILPGRCHFTRSVDAATTLVPPGYRYEIGSASDEGDGYEAFLISPGGHHMAAYSVCRPTAALALTVACLRHAQKSSAKGGRTEIKRR